MHTVIRYVFKLWVIVQHESETAPEESGCVQVTLSERIRARTG